jgi:hypothetical protein
MPSGSCWIVAPPPLCDEGPSSTTGSSRVVLFACLAPAQGARFIGFEEGERFAYCGRRVLLSRSSAVARRMTSQNTHSAEGACSAAWIHRRCSCSAISRRASRSIRAS